MLSKPWRVYGRPALVVALGLRTRVRLGPRSDGGVRLALSDLGVVETVSWSEVVDYGERTCNAWLRFMRGASSDDLDAMRTDDPTHLVKIALAETVRAVQPGPEAPGPEAPGPGRQGAGVQEAGLEVEITSDLPIGAGFGSSASLAVAVSGALLALLTGDADSELIDRIALEVERPCALSSV